MNLIAAAVSDEPNSAGAAVCPSIVGGTCIPQPPLGSGVLFARAPIGVPVLASGLLPKAQDAAGHDLNAFHQILLGESAVPASSAPAQPQGQLSEFLAQSRRRWLSEDDAPLPAELPAEAASPAVTSGFPIYTVPQPSVAGGHRPADSWTDSSTVLVSAPRGQPVVARLALDESVVPLTTAPVTGVPLVAARVAAVQPAGVSMLGAPLEQPSIRPGLEKGAAADADHWPLPQQAAAKLAVQPQRAEATVPVIAAPVSAVPVTAVQPAGVSMLGAPLEQPSIRPGLENGAAADADPGLSPQQAAAKLAFQPQRAEATVPVTSAHVSALPVAAVPVTAVPVAAVPVTAVPVTAVQPAGVPMLVAPLEQPFLRSALQTSVPGTPAQTNRWQGASQPAIDSLPPPVVPAVAQVSMASSKVERPEPQARIDLVALQQVVSEVRRTLATRDLQALDAGRSITVQLPSGCGPVAHLEVQGDGQGGLARITLIASSAQAGVQLTRDLQQRPLSLDTLATDWRVAVRPEVGTSSGVSLDAASRTAPDTGAGPSGGYGSQGQGRRGSGQPDADDVVLALAREQRRAGAGLGARSELALAFEQRVLLGE